MTPNFFLVGAPKCGTTSLYFYLDQHPQIYMSPLKEPHFLADEIRLVNFTEPFRRMAEEKLAGLSEYLAGDMSSKFSAGPIERWEDYLRLFRNAKDHLVRGDASTCYLWSPTAARNIAVRFPGAKIVIVLRNPVDRAFSQYLHMLTFADDEISFRAYVERCLQSSSRQFGELYPFLYFGFYANQVERYLNLFPRDGVRIVWYEDYQRDPVSVFKEMFRFLGVDPDFGPDSSERYMEARVPRSYVVNKALKPVWSRVKTAVPEAVAATMKRAVFRDRKSMRMSAEDRRFLCNLYREDVRNLEQLTGRDLRHWLS